MKRGVPKQSLKDLRPDWREFIIHEASEGASDVEIRSQLKKDGDNYRPISDDLWYRFLKEEPEFSRTMQEADALREAWWLSKGRKNLENKNFNYQGYGMNMKNRFGWRDKQDMKVEGSLNINIIDKFKK